MSKSKGIISDKQTRSPISQGSCRLKPNQYTVETALWLTIFIRQGPHTGDKKEDGNQHSHCQQVSNE